MARRILSVLAILVLLSACSNKGSDVAKPSAPAQEKEAVSQDEGASGQKESTPVEEAQAFELSLAPSETSSKTVLEARPRGFSLEDADVVWLLNGAPVSTPRIPYFDSPEMDIHKGDTVQVEATVDGVEVASNIVNIVNAKPVLKHVTLTPAEFAPGQNIGVDVEAADADGDEVKIEYEWTVNDHQAGIGAELEETLTRGDTFTVKVTPYDGEEYGKSITLYRKVGNLPPRIEEHNDFSFDGQEYIYMVKASDPDGDPLTFFLKSGPKGMTINSQTGEVRWAVPADYAGAAKYEVAASDGQGGEARYSMSFTLGEGGGTAGSQ
jgi:hypothetical protein